LRPNIVILSEQHSVLLDFLIFNYHYLAGPMHPVAV
jgi:hypothetical protein